MRNNAEREWRAMTPEQRRAVYRARRNPPTWSFTVGDLLKLLAALFVLAVIARVYK